MRSRIDIIIFHAKTRVSQRVALILSVVEIESLQSMKESESIPISTATVTCM